MQKSKGMLPDWRDVSDFYCEGDSGEDIVFVPVEADLATRSSSMEVIRKLSVDSSATDEEQENCGKGRKMSAEDSRPRLRRSPSQGLESAVAPSSRPDMHQLSFRRGRVEI